MAHKVLLCNDDSVIFCNFLYIKDYPTLYHNKKQKSTKIKLFYIFLIPYYIVNDITLNGIKYPFI